MISLLSLENIVSGYGDIEIIHSVSLSVGKGEVVSVIGPNGAGKTTLLKTVLGLVRATSGKINFCNQEITSLSSDRIVKLGFGCSPQGQNLHPEMTVEENLRAGAYVVKDQKAVARSLERVYQVFPKLKEMEQRKAGFLSGGERQILSLARTLMLEPKLVLLDEPSLGLDPKFLTFVYEKISEMNDSGVAFLLVEQNVKRAIKVSDRTYLLKLGRIVLEGESSAIAQRTEIKEAYLGG